MKWSFLNKKSVDKTFYGLKESDRLLLINLPRFSETKITFFGNDFIVPDACTFLSSHQEIFIKQIYKFVCSRKTPVIIDCGANVGLATIYFKLNYPGAYVLAYEPDPNLFTALRKNVQSLNLRDVKLVNEAIGEKRESLLFCIEGGHSGMLVTNPTDDTITVPVAPLNEVLQQFPIIDFLKIDIEGHEINVLPSIMGELGNVQFLFLEYHTFIGKPQELSVIIKIIEKAGFRYYIKEASSKEKPFVERELFYKMDMLINIFCYRE